MLRKDRIDQFRPDFFHFGIGQRPVDVLFRKPRESTFADEADKAVDLVFELQRQKDAMLVRFAGDEVTINRVNAVNLVQDC